MTQPNLSRAAQKVQDTLNKFGIPLQVVEFPESTRTAAQAAEAIGCSVGQIAKSLVFRKADSGRAVLIIASGSNRVDEKKMSALIGERILRPDADFVRQHTGYAIGGIPPVGHTTPLETWLDEDLWQFEEIWAAAGTPNAVFRLTPDKLAKVTGGSVVAVK